MPANVKRNKVKVAKKVVPVKDKETVVSQGHKKKKENRTKLTKELRKSGANKRKRRGFVYIKPLPRGFHEEQLRIYLTQFGAITRLRLVRSNKTLNSKGYALIEFRYPEVAEIAADAMSNYMLFKNVIETVFIPSDKTKFDYFKNGLMKTTKNGKTVLTSTSIEAEESLVESNNRLMTKSAQIVVSKINIAKANLVYGIDYDVDALTTEQDEDSSENEDHDMASGDDVLTSTTIEAEESLVESNNRLMTKSAQIVVSKINKAKAILVYGIDYDVDALTTEQDEDSSENEDDDMASGDKDDDMASGDETFDPMKMDVDSDHSVEDFECDTDASDDDEDDDDGIKVKLETAVSKARQASDKLNKTDSVEPAPTPVEKKQAKVAEKPAPVVNAAVEKKAPANAAPKEKKAEKKKLRPVAVASPVVVKPRGRPAEKPAPVVNAAVEKKAPANAAPKEKKAAKKKQRPVAVASPVVVKPKGRPAEKPAPVVAESPVQTRTTRFHMTLIANKIKKLGVKVGKAKRRR